MSFRKLFCIWLVCSCVGIGIHELVFDYPLCYGWLRASPALIIGALCALPLFWRIRENHAAEWLTAALVGIAAAYFTLRWTILPTPPCAWFFFFVLPWPAVLCTIVMPYRPPPARRLSEVLPSHSPKEGSL